MTLEKGFKTVMVGGFIGIWSVALAYMVARVMASHYSRKLSQDAQSLEWMLRQRHANSIS